MNDGLMNLLAEGEAAIAKWSDKAKTDMSGPVSEMLTQFATPILLLWQTVMLAGKEGHSLEKVLEGVNLIRESLPDMQAATFAYGRYIGRLEAENDDLPDVGSTLGT